MNELIGQTYCGIYKGVYAEKEEVYKECVKCLLGRYPGQIADFEFGRGEMKHLLLNSSVNELDLRIGNKYFIRFEEIVPYDTSGCPDHGERRMICKGGIFVCEVVGEYSEAEESGTQLSGVESPENEDGDDEIERIELLIKHGEPESLEDLISLYIYQFHSEFDGERIRNMIQIIQDSYKRKL